MYSCISRVHADERQLLEFRQQEVDSLQHKVTSLRSELKTEMNYAKQANEAEVKKTLPFFIT